MDIIISSSKESEKALVMRLIKYAGPIMEKAEEMEKKAGGRVESDTDDNE